MVENEVKHYTIVFSPAIIPTEFNVFLVVSLYYLEEFWWLSDPQEAF